MGSEGLVHVFLVSFPAQGHVNPLLRLGKRLASRGLFVTFSTTEKIGKEMREASNNITNEPTPLGHGFIRFEFFEDGWDPKRQDMDNYYPQLELVIMESLPKMLKKHADADRPVSCLINNPFVPWVSDVAHNLGIPTAMLWVQSAACFSVYYHYHHGLVPFPTEIEPKIDVQIPCMPLLKYDEVPSFLYPTTPYIAARKTILGQMKNLSKPFCILMDTFRDIEAEVIEHMSGFFPIKPVGPLFKIPNPKNKITKHSNDSVKGDFMKADECVIEWLESKPVSSVVYVSFGSVVYLEQEQVEEIAHGILNSGVLFLWVMKPPNKDSGRKLQVLPHGFLEKAGDKGKVVKWSPQEQVLAHPSVACFVTHCGWNSAMEALTNGVPVVAFPRLGDQVTNAKYLVDEFKVGIRMCRGEAEKRVVPRDEVEESLREAMWGALASEMKANALNWKKAAEEAVAESGSSDQNIQDFVNEITRRTSLKL